MKSARLFVAVAFAFLSVGCASKPCSLLHVVQYTDKSRETDLELDNGHIYAVPLDLADIQNAPPPAVPSDLWAVTKPSWTWAPDRPHPNTGDAVTLCSLKARDGSEHYSLHIGSSTVVTPTLIR